MFNSELGSGRKKLFDPKIDRTIDMFNIDKV
jgi:hypothetical protein